ncbi:MBL fold metallo-hydrolase [Shinella sp.]|uniref:MBL fold metallo-hydrolase n=1 Tax=Shinella sp. TaxID=1870904 RepID=UPI003F6F5B47
METYASNQFGYDLLLRGFPGRTERGFLGWSTTVLLRTAAGYALFDTGAAGDRPGLFNALAKRGIERADIKTIILSHLHFDHVANVECFPRAEFLLHETERAYFESDGARDAAMPVFLVEALLRQPRLRLIAGEPEILPGVHVLCTPGHTGGHISLALNADGRQVVLAQDALKHRGEIDAVTLAGAFDSEAARNSIDRILKMADVIVPGHDAPLARTSKGFRPLSACHERIDIVPGGQSHALTVQ